MRLVMTDYGIRLNVVEHCCGIINVRVLTAQYYTINIFIRNVYNTDCVDPIYF